MSTVLFARGTIIPITFVPLESIEIRKAEHEGLVPRKKVVERDGQTFEEIYWVKPDWFGDANNLKQMSDADVSATFRSSQATLADAHQAYVDATKRGADKGELDKLHEAEHNAYWARRHLGREIKNRQLPSDLAPVRSESRKVAVQRTDKASIQETPPEPVQRVIDEVKYSDAETRRYTKERMTGKDRSTFYDEFLEGRDLDPRRVKGIFFQGWGSFIDAPTVVNLAMGMTQGFSFEEMFKRIPQVQRAKYKPEVLQIAANEVRTVIPAVSAWSQNYYKTQGLDKIKLYRGVSGTTFRAFSSQMDDSKTVNVAIGTHPISSWTTNRKYAETYAKGDSVAKEVGAVVELEVPVNRVVWSSEATASPGMGPTGAPEVLITTSQDEVLKVPKSSITPVRHGGEKAQEERKI
jgi:hypothetical protein